MPERTRALRVILADDHVTVRHGLRLLIDSQADMKVVAEASDGEAAIRQALELKPDVIVLDISMPGMTGLEVASLLRKGQSTAAVVFLTVHDEEEFVHAAQAVGGIGYVIKPRIASDLMKAVLEAKAGRPFVSPF